MFAEAEAEAERARTAERGRETVEETFGRRTRQRRRRARQHGLGARPATPCSSHCSLEPVPADAALAVHTAASPRWCSRWVLQVLHLQPPEPGAQRRVRPRSSATVYGWFGATLVPRWDLTAYSVKQLGAEAEGGERLATSRTAFGAERAARAAAAVLRLTLQDRFGKAVATRDLEPRRISAGTRRDPAPARARPAHRRGTARRSIRARPPSARDRRLPAWRERRRHRLRQRSATPHSGLSLRMKDRPYAYASTPMSCSLRWRASPIVRFRQIARQFGAGLAARRK